MARKTMAERYASQRSSKAGRRRALPRLSDGVSTPDREGAPRGGAATDLYDVHEVRLSRHAGAGDGATTFTAGAVAAAATAPIAASSTRGAMPRRVGVTRGGAPTASASATSVVNYAYVRRDLRRIAVTAVAMLVLLIVLNVILQAIVH